jgi:hypothetical protein
MKSLEAYKKQDKLKRIGDKYNFQNINFEKQVLKEFER